MKTMKIEVVYATPQAFSCNQLHMSPTRLRVSRAGFMTWVYRVAEGRMTMRYEVISADCHIDLIWLPPDLFTANASAALRDRMPYVTDGLGGPKWVSRGGAEFGLQNGMGSAGRKYVPGPVCYTYLRLPTSDLVVIPVGVV